jgi:hypothetical protein
VLTPTVLITPGTAAGDTLTVIVNTVLSPIRSCAG